MIGENKLRDLQFWYPNVPRKLIMAKGLSIQAKFVYIYMCCQSKKFEFYHEPMANELGIYVKTLKKYLQELIELGWITKGNQMFKDGRLGAIDYTVNTSPKKKKNKNTDGQKTASSNLPTKYNSDTSIPITNDSNTSIPIMEENKKSLSNDKQKIEYSEEFYQLWTKYKEGTKSAAFKAWNKLTAKERQAALDKVDDYLTYCRRKGREKKDTSSYLNQKCFNEDTWTKIPECYVLVDGENERVAGFKSWMCREFADLIYHRKPLTFEQMNECIDKYTFNQTEWAMRQLCKRDIHQYFSIAQGIEKVIMEELPEFAEQ